MQEQSPLHKGVPDLRHLLSWPVGMACPPQDDFHRIAGCILREVGRLGGDLQFLEAVEGLDSQRGDHHMDAVVRGGFHPAGIPLDTSSLGNGHASIPRSWIVVPCVPPRYGEPPEAMILVVCETPRIIDRDGYLRMMEVCSVDAHRAVRILFNTLQTALATTEHHTLVQESRQRLAAIGEQLTHIFASRNLTW